jgi:hypothetical protein
MISVHDTGMAGALGDLSRFREEFHQCLAARADTLFELTEAVLCTDGPVTSLVELSLAAEHRRGHGALYDSLNQGRIDIGRFRNVVARQHLPRCDDGRIVLAIDVSNWLRPDANTSPDRLFCHTYARGKGQAQMIPGWPYSFVAALEPGRSSWTAILDAQRLAPADEDTAVAAAHCGRWSNASSRSGTGRRAIRRSGSSATAAMTVRGWRSCWPICPFGYWCGCARTA